MESDEIKKSLRTLKELLNERLISAEDYEQRKNQILDNITKADLRSKRPSEVHKLRAPASEQPRYAEKKEMPALSLDNLDEQLDEILGFQTTSPKPKVETPPKSPTTRNLRNVVTLIEHANYVFSLVLHGTRLISSSSDFTIKVWDLRTLKTLHTLKEHKNTVSVLALNDIYLFSGSWDNTIKLWDLKTFQLVDTLQGHSNYVSALATAGNILYSGSWDKTIQMWDVQKRKLIASALEESGGKLTGGHTGYISALCVVPGVCLVSGSYDHLIKVWSFNLECKKTLSGHSNWIYSIKVIGLNIYSASRDETLKVWNLETGKCIKTVKEHTDYVCSLAHYGNKLYSGGMDRIIKVYNLDTMECEQTLEGHTQNVSALVASSTTLYSGSWDKTIKIWQ